MKKILSVILTLTMVVTLVTVTPEGSGGNTVFELPITTFDAAQIAWSTGATGLTMETLRQSDGFLYLESSAPLIPVDWGYGIFLAGSFNNHDWARHAYNVTGAVGSNTIAFRLNLHPDYTAAMAGDSLQFGFYSWSLGADGQWGSTTDTISMRLTRAYLVIPSVAPTAPTVPRNFQASAGDGRVVLSWSAPESNGGSAIIRYEVSRDNGSTWLTASSNTSHTFTGLTNGQSYTFRVRAVNAVGNSTAATVTATPYAASVTEPDFSDFIVIDQFGYRPQSVKTAVIRNPQRGPDRNLSFSPGNLYQVINVATKMSVHQGAPVRRFADDLHSGDEIWWFDFSAVTAPGRYYILDVQRNVRSFTFRIADNVYNEVLKHAIRTFYYQRVGFAKEARFAGEAWADGASHVREGQSTQVRCYFAQTRSTNEQLTQSQRNEAAIAAAASERNLTGGWYDAGDYNQYTAWTAAYIEIMLQTYRERPEVFTDDYNIPESGNGIPDIIDEARWGMDHLLRLQNDSSFVQAFRPPNYPVLTNFDGSLLSVIGHAHGSPPSTSTGRSLYGAPSTNATYAGARTFSLGAVVFEEFDPAYAATLRTAATKAWNWAEANPNVVFHNDERNGNNLAAGPQGTDDNLEMRLQTAINMFEMTRDRNYLTIFENNRTLLPLYQWWGSVNHYYTGQNLMYFKYMGLPEASQDVINALRTERGGLVFMFNRATDFIGRLGHDGYRSFLLDYPWGSNRAKAEMGLNFYYYGKLRVEPNSTVDFTTAAEDYLHYLHGVNPFNWVYLSNMNDYGASKSLTSFYHTWFAPGTPWSKAGESQYGPAPGFLSGGPNASSNGGWRIERGSDSQPWPRPFGYTPTAHELALGNHILNNIVGSPPAKWYMDINDGWPINSWEITENSCGYQLNYIRLLSKFACPQRELDVDNNTVVLRNRSEVSITTKGFYLTDSDNPSALFMWQIPTIIIRPNATVRFSNIGVEPVLKRNQVNFNVPTVTRVNYVDAYGDIRKHWRRA